ncbi:MAG: hypothetical protein KDC98_02455, partial [Planctomycetes bacterium]|nr:hypothetical protein [Planctomycetota bacterium]
PCGPSLGATLTGRNGRRMVLRVGGMNGMLGALGIGGAPASTVSCGPATTPIAAVILVPDPNGISLAVPLSPSLMGLLTLQYAELLPGGQLAFSNGVVAVLRCQAP